MAVVAFTLGLVGVAGTMIALTPPPAPPLPPLVWLDDVTTDVVQVEFELPRASSPASEASYEPELLTLLPALGAPVELATAKQPKVKLAKRKRARDEAPLPPWLVAKKSRRR